MSYKDESKTIMATTRRVDHIGTLSELISLLEALRASAQYDGVKCRMILLGREAVDPTRYELRSIYNE